LFREAFYPIAALIARFSLDSGSGLEY